MAAGSVNATTAIQPVHVAPAHSIAELTERLRAHEPDDTSRSHGAHNFFWLCTELGSVSVRRNFPVHVVRLATDPPLEVRFIRASDPAAARELSDAATRVAQGCAGPPDEEMGAATRGKVTVTPFLRGGWSGVQVVSNMRLKRPAALLYRPITGGRVVASRGVWFADLAWEVRGNFGYAPRSWTTRGLRVAEWALSLAG